MLNVEQLMRLLQDENRMKRSIYSVGVSKKFDCLMGFTIVP